MCVCVHAYVIYEKCFEVVKEDGSSSGTMMHRKSHQRDRMLKEQEV